MKKTVIAIEVTAAEREALRRALAGLVADERARFPGRLKRSRMEMAAERVYEKLFERSPVGGSKATTLEEQAP